MNNTDSMHNKFSPLRVAFIHAPDPKYAITQNYGMKFMPVWVYTLAAHIPDDGRFSLLLFDLQFDTVNDVEKADVYLLSGINQDQDMLISVKKDLKDKYPEAEFFIGGPIAWSNDMAGTLENLQVFDHICIGDGEEMINEILEKKIRGKKIEKVIRAQKRFDISKAPLMHRTLLKNTINRYYGAVVEVSRGCPFLCEFCDIRVMADNNKAHLAEPKQIIEEINFLYQKGVRQVTLACDNFIGDQRWAMEVVDEILQWQKATGGVINIYTWLTINVYKMDELLRKMRQAGFDLLFIGIESYDTNSLLETAKVQNTAVEMVEATKQIQSYGFIIVAGLIFGFDADSEDFSEITIDGILRSGLISGDPNWLTALPGTPLYRRMKLAGRLRSKFATHGGVKFQTNILYLLPKDIMVNGFRDFILKYLDGKFQYNRFKTYLESLNRANYVPLKGSGFGNLKKFLVTTMYDRRAIAQLWSRLWRFFNNPRNIYFGLKGFYLAWTKRQEINGWFGYFQFWGFAWTNAMAKYQVVADETFDIESVKGPITEDHILPSAYAESADEPIPENKINAQLKYTTAQLKKVIREKIGPDTVS